MRNHAIFQLLEWEKRHNFAELDLEISSFFVNFLIDYHWEKNCEIGYENCWSFLLTPPPPSPTDTHATKDMRNNRQCNVLTNARVNFGQSEKSSLPFRLPIRGGGVKILVTTGRRELGVNRKSPNFETSVIISTFSSFFLFGSCFGCRLYNL